MFTVCVCWALFSQALMPSRPNTRWLVHLAHTHNTDTALPLTYVAQMDAQCMVKEEETLYSLPRTF